VTSMTTDARLHTTVGGKYLIDETIGHGGMGTVYRASHRELGGPVAVKFLHPMFQGEPELRARFRREAVALARLRHPCSVSLLDFGEDGASEPFIVMELVRGLPFSAALASAPGGMALPRIAEIFDQLLGVLDVAHGMGIVHRDIKPSNVMLLETDHLKLLDFGLVQLPGMDVDEVTATGIVHGTPDYMSPEQCQGDPTGPPTDVYAAGIMLYEALTGRQPFEGRSAAGLMASHVFVDVPPMMSRSLGRAISAPLESLVRCAIAKSAGDRPTATEFRRELASILRGTDTSSLALKRDHHCTTMRRSAARALNRSPTHVRVGSDE